MDQLVIGLRIYSHILTEPLFLSLDSLSMSDLSLHASLGESPWKYIDDEMILKIGILPFVG